MKKIRSLGKSLDRDEQKKISGGGPHDLWCIPAGGGAPVFLGSYLYMADCMSHFNGVCLPSGYPYTACRCWSGDIYQACEPA